MIGKHKTDLSANELKRHVEYDPLTGIFTRLMKEPSTRLARTWNTRYGGQPAGWTNERGYVEVSINGKVHLGHRLAWLYMTGEWPVAEVDHVNGEPSDNRWANLRAASRRQNAMNTKIRSHSKTGVKGVHYYPQWDRYQAKITVAGHCKSLGYYATADEAGSVYQEAAKRLFGEFARVA